MKKYSIILLVTAWIFSGCSKVTTIPEISPHLFHQPVLDLTDKNLAGTIIENNSELIFTSLEGKIFRWNPENNMADFLINLNSEIDPTLFTQGNYFCLKLLKTGKYSIFDLKEMKEIARLESTIIRRIVGLDHEIAVYLADPGELTIYNYRSRQSLKKLEIKGKQTVYNAEFRGDNLYILSGENLYVYSKSRDTVETIHLKQKPSSGFLTDGEVIYYGSRQRELVKFSLTSRKTQWTLKIGEVLTINPQKIGEYIVIIPENNNIYFFNKNGTLYWWENLNSTRLLPPIPMKENAAVFLWNKQIKFFNYKKKQVTTYPLDQKVKSNPIRIDDYIYVVSEDKVNPGEDADTVIPAHRLSKIGNFFGVEIQAEPQYIKPMGKSIRFDLQSYNLVEPQYKIKILKNQPGDQVPVFEKILGVDDKPSFLWIPKESGQYRLVIEIEAENKKGLTVEETFTAVDVDKMINHYYYQLQIQSDTNWFN